MAICFGDGSAEETDCAGADDKDCGVCGERGAAVCVHCYAEGFDEGAETWVECLGESGVLVGDHIAGLNGRTYSICLRGG